MKAQIFILCVLISLAYSFVNVNGPLTSNRLKLYLDIHAEGWSGEVLNEGSFNAHRNAIKEVCDIFKAKRAVVNIEASPVFTEACVAWAPSGLPNFLELMLADGHGVILHADVGSEPQQSMMENKLANYKTSLESATKRTLLGVSGVSSAYDWIQICHDKGFKFITSAVVYGLKSYTNLNLLDDRLREHNQNCDNSVCTGVSVSEVTTCTAPGGCHEHMPQSLNYTLVPYFPKSGADWMAKSDNSTNTPLLLGGVDTITNLGSDGDGNVLTSDDVNEFIKALEYRLDRVVPNEINVLGTAWSIGSLPNITVVHELVDKVQPFVDNGKVEWVTSESIYEDVIRTSVMPVISPANILLPSSLLLIIAVIATLLMR